MHHDLPALIWVKAHAARRPCATAGQLIYIKANASLFRDRDRIEEAGDAYGTAANGRAFCVRR
jgi:hypothetical protein